MGRDQSGSVENAPDGGDRGAGAVLTQEVGADGVGGGVEALLRELGAQGADPFGEFSLDASGWVVRCASAGLECLPAALS